jgi:hypothetical protein
LGKRGTAIMIKTLFSSDREIINIDDVEGKERLKVFDKIGLEAKYTDFAYALGGEIAYDYNGRPVSVYQLKTNAEETGYQVVCGNHIFGYYQKQTPEIGKGARLLSYLPKSMEVSVRHDESGVPYIYKDLYPQTIAFRTDKNGVKDTKDFNGVKWVVPNFKANDYVGYAKEYNFNNGLYVELPLNNFYGSRVLSNGTEINRGDKAYFKVEPIKWYIDEKTGLMVSEKILSASIPFEYMNNPKEHVKKLVNKNKN